MRLRMFCILAAWLVLTPDAMAGDRDGIFHRVSCSVVRNYVAKYSAAAAETWARSKGATGEINAARRCLKSAPVVTAQNVQN